MYMLTFSPRLLQPLIGKVLGRMRMQRQEVVVGLECATQRCRIIMRIFKNARGKEDRYGVYAMEDSERRVREVPG